MTDEWDSVLTPIVGVSTVEWLDEAVVEAGRSPGGERRRCLYGTL